MDDSDEIRPGDRFEAVDDFCGPMGTIVTASRPWGWAGLWAVLEGATLRRLADHSLWRRLPRTDAPAVKVGDVVRDPALLVAGMRVEWTRGGGEPCAGEDGGVTTWAGVGQSWSPHPCLPPDTQERVRTHGVRILAIPEPPRAEAVQMLPLSPEKIQQAREALKAMQPPPARCKPGCTPKEPCWEGSYDGGCPVWREGVTGAPRIDSNGISPDALPPARASTYQPRCAGLAGYGSWNGRAGLTKEGT